jgi:hypothetical protein
MDHTLSAEEKINLLFANSLPLLNCQIWCHLRTNLTPVFTSGKMKMFYLGIPAVRNWLTACTEPLLTVIYLNTSAAITVLRN